MFENLTIVLFTRNRYDKASVIIQFWLDRGARVLVLDASTNTRLKNQFSAKEKLVYFRAESFWERALFASSNIESIYSIIHSDDSLIFPSTVIEGITVLEKQREVGYLYGPGNFTSWWFESSSWEYSNNMGGESPHERMTCWAEKPNDLMWGALWRSNHLRKALKIWGESTKVFPFETNLHTTSLYLAGAALASGQLLSGPLHFSRHWLAPVDETFKIVRSVKSPFGIDLSDPENRKMFDLWRIKLLEGINQLLGSREMISLENLDYLLKLFERNEPNLGFKLHDKISLQQRVREKVLIELIKVENEKPWLSPISGLMLTLIKQFKLIINYLQRRRLGWFESSLLIDFTEYEVLRFGIETQKYSKLAVKHFSRLFSE